MKILLVILSLTGCANITPYVAIKHVDATPAQGGHDAWDLGCIGVKKRGQLTLKTAWCENIRGGGLIELSIEYDILKK